MNFHKLLSNPPSILILVAIVLAVASVFQGKTPTKLPVLQYISLALIAFLLTVGFGIALLAWTFHFLAEHHGIHLSLAQGDWVNVVSFFVGAGITTLLLRPLRS